LIPTPLCFIFRGEGLEMFSSGADLGLVHNIINTPERGVMMCQFMTELLDRIRNSGMISVCCINGLAIGGGSELTTCTDFRLMSDTPDHYIHFFHPKIGAIPGWGGIHRLVSIIGRQQSIRLTCATPKLYFDEARDIGFVDKVLSIKSCEDWKYATYDFVLPYLEQKYHKSLLAIKHSIAVADHSSQEIARENEIKNFQTRWYAEDHTEAMKKIMTPKTPK
jgi:enoyl-CoA hydratase/carnithine racemase